MVEVYASVVRSESSNQRWSELRKLFGIAELVLVRWGSV